MVRYLSESAPADLNKAGEEYTRQRHRNRRLCQTAERCARAFVASKGDTVQGDLESMLFLVADAIEAADALLLVLMPGGGQDGRIEAVASQQGPEPVRERLAGFSLDALMSSATELPDIYHCQEVLAGQSMSDWQYLLGGKPGLVLPLINQGKLKAVMAFAFELDDLVLSREGRSALLTLAHMAVVFTDVGVLDAALQCQLQRVAEKEQLSGTGSWDFYPATKLLRVSPQLKQIFGLQENDAIHLPYLARCLHPDDRQRVLDQITSSLALGEGYQLECRLLLPDGRQRRVLVRSNVERQVNGELWRHGLIQEVGLTRQLENQLPLYHHVIEQMTEGVMVLSSVGLVEFVNPAFCRMTGYSAETLAGQHVKNHHVSRHPPAFYRHVLIRSCRSGSWVGEVRSQHVSGDPVTYQVRVTAIRQEGASVRYLAVLLQGVVTDPAPAMPAIRQGNCDALTGLPDRNLALQRIDAAIAVLIGQHPQSLQVGVVVINIDDFKPVNDSLGHVYGDKLLKAFGQRLVRCGLEHGNLARLGSDEFCVLIPNLSCADDATDVIQRIRQLKQQCYDLDAGFEVYVSVCLGVALYPQHGDTALQLLNNADTALHAAKRSGRDSVCYYHNDMTLRAAARLERINQLRVALQDGQALRLFYQPQVNATTGALVGLEALIRWQHPQEGLLLPDRFLSHAHDAGLMLEVDRFSLQQAALQIWQWRDQGLAVVPVAVNVSQQSFVAGNLLEHLQSLVERFDLQAGDVEIELTEEALLEPTPQVLALIAAINRLGIGLVIDDFGTGYSSLGYLHRFPLQKLKIDRSLVAGVDNAGDNRVIARTIVRMAQELSFGLVAEGVENVYQADFLSRSGCVVHQGFWYDQALDPESIERMLVALPTGPPSE
ncbi:EAL domain-containing protein [Oceanobacter sp. 5_MG-2023]|uniref:putative bifunctional diguanylate cyclase/phosphodiesterase n=1 Tax=Oceanobacter sp. 5_MG-2023 TaxID=3062645 RepID=UPI0026E3A550|nr:bifunctional diguanylate cyclase/phosphodiesterase [Oceanobacter sp. 5_MG-2023]MDO6683295.1 EAL domain-containing protein [Oceanobacter sp. 5_MG-2023]